MVTEPTGSPSDQRPAPTAGYSGTPLARKLGIKPEAAVLLRDAPAGFAVPDLPPGVAAGTDLDAGPFDVALLFATRRADLPERFAVVAATLTPAGGLWVCWPKKAAVRAGLAVTDLDENQVRATGLAAGLVDNKVAAVNEVWSGLRFVRRVAGRSR